MATGVRENKENYYRRIAFYTKLFFATMKPEELQEMMQAGDQFAIVAELHRRGTIAAIVRSIAKQWGVYAANANAEMVDDIDDYIQTATLILLRVAKSNKFKMHLTPGELGGYICQWVEQKIKRQIFSEYENTNILSEKKKDIEEYNSGDVPSFDDILIARQAAMRDFAESADVIDITTRIPGTNANNTLTPSGKSGNRQYGKVMRIENLKSRSYQARVKSEGLEGVFKLASRGIRTPQSAAISKTTAAAL